jgi:hypothetical protein
MYTAGMLARSLLLWALVLIGCDNHDKTLALSDATVGSEPATASDSQAAGRSVTGVTQDASLPVLPPSNPQRFRISYSNSPCPGPCPVYDVSIGDDGTVSFLGKARVARAGLSIKQGSASAARELYDALAAAKFFELGHYYLSGTEVCREEITDGINQTWTVEVDGIEKSVLLYTGCIAIDDLTALNDLSLRATKVFTVEDWATSASPGAGTLRRTGSYRVSRGERALGMVEVKDDEWTLRGCDGTELTQGPTRFKLLPPLSPPYVQPEILLTPIADEVGRVLFTRPELNSESTSDASTQNTELTMISASGC